jgi:hypothetical protein
MSQELRYYDALKRITQYQTVDQLRRHSEKHWGVCFEEALEMAYENVIEEARIAIRGKRRPKDPKSEGAANSVRHETNDKTKEAV